MMGLGRPDRPARRPWWPAGLGHGDTHTLWRHDAGVFAEAEHAPRIAPEQSAREAREQLRSEQNVRMLFPRGLFEGAPNPLAGAQKSTSAAENASTRGRIRTCDLWLRRPALYPLSYARVSG
jgi:hypothetical protein